MSVTASLTAADGGAPAGPVCGVTLLATLVFQGTQSLDGTASLSQPMPFTVPSSIPITTGGTKSGQASLQFSQSGGARVTCAYEVHGASAFALTSCDRGAFAGSPETADSFVLHIKTADHGVGATGDKVQLTAVLNAPDGSICGGANKCEQTYMCHAGACIGSNPVVCTTNDPNATGATCDPSSGACVTNCVPGYTFCGSLCTDTNTDSNNCGSCGNTCPPAQACNGGGVCAATHGTQPLPGHVAIGIENVPVVGPLPPTNQLTIGIALPLTNRPALETFIAELSDPSSPNFHQYLTPAQFGAMYGASQSDYSALADFARANGLTVTRSFAGRNMLELSGTVAAIEKTFNVALNVYLRPDGSTFFAPAYDPSVNLGVPIRFISGLDNFAVPIPANGGGGTAPDISCSNSVGASWPYGANDLRSLYLPCIGPAVDGTGQTIGLVELGSYYPKDISDYTSVFSDFTNFWPAAAGNVMRVPVPRTASEPPLPLLTESCPASEIPGPGCLASRSPISSNGGWDFVGGEGEVALDIEMALAMAPNATILVYEQDPRLFDPAKILAEMAEDDIAQQISSSWLWHPYASHPNLPEIFAQFAAQGQSVFWASGDTGAYIGKYAEVPSPIIESPYMTVVGGTSLKTTGSGTSTQYAGETTWNDAAQEGCSSSSPCNSISGGGFCAKFTYTDGTQIRVANNTLPMPAYQVGVNPSNVELSANPLQARMIPDVSIVADNLFVYQATGSPGEIAYDPVERCSGGTSAAAPLWAAMTALINQESQMGRVGFLNPQLYGLATFAAGSYYAKYFNDVNDGSSNNWDGSGSYHAVAGYDLATGLGSPRCGLLPWLATFCILGTTKCTSDTQEATCDADFHWGAPTTCASGACVGANCTVCKPKQLRCTPDTTTPEICSDLGDYWVAGAVTAGYCGAICTPGEVRCIGTTSETCNSIGTGWDLTPCNDCGVIDCNGTCRGVSNACAPGMTCSADGKFTLPACSLNCGPTASACCDSITHTCSCCGI